MFDSKNVMWLGSFFSLLLITYCVSTHLDDLNPNIANIPNKESKKVDDSFKNLSSNISNEIQFPKNVHIENLNTNKKISNLDKNDSVKKVEESKEILHINPRVVDSNKDEKNETLKPKSSISKTDKDDKHFRLTDKFIEDKSLKDTNKTTKHSNQKAKRKITKQKPKSHRKKKIIIKKIKEIRLSKDSFKSLLHGKENNYINMIAYKYGLNKSRFIKIVAADKLDLAKLKRVFVKKHIKTDDIYLKVDRELDGFKIYLYERR